MIEAYTSTVDMLASDVHDAYLNSFELGETTPFKSKIYVVENQIDTPPGTAKTELDIANNPFQTFPEDVKKLNRIVAEVIIEAIDENFESAEPEIDEQFVLRAMVRASCAWARDMHDNIKDKYAPNEDRHRAWHDIVVEQMKDYPTTPAVAQQIDREMVLVGIASTIKPAYMYWLENYEPEQILSIPGVINYAQAGQAILNKVASIRASFRD
jgi:hypothetical protein